MALSPDEQVLARDLNDNFRQSVTRRQVLLSHEMEKQTPGFIRRVLDKVRDYNDFPLTPTHLSGSIDDFSFEIFYYDRDGKPFLDRDITRTTRKIFLKFWHEP